MTNIVDKKYLKRMQKATLPNHTQKKLDCKKVTLENK